MKYLVFSDIHGSFYYAKIMESIIKKEKPNKIILLGDLYYHGPRNPLPVEYNPKEVANLLNQYQDKIIAIKGNCDAEVDQMISLFKIKNHLKLTINNKKVMFTHGHKYNIDNVPSDVDVLVYGHFHTCFIKKTDDKIFINAGSITYPKDNTPHSYLIIDKNILTIKDIEGLSIDQIIL